jgi:integrase
LEGRRTKGAALALRYIRKHGARWRVEKSVDGRYLKRTFDTLEAAVEFRDELLSRIDRDRNLRQSTVTGKINVGQLVDLWFNGPPGVPERGFRNRKYPPLSPNTVRDFEERIATQIPLIANHDVNELLTDPLILEALFHERLTPDNARKLFTILNLTFKAAQRGKLGAEHRIPANPCAMQQLPEIDTTARAVPTASEVAKILIAASEVSPIWDLFCRLTATLGTRCAETVALRVNDFDVERRRVHIDEAAARALDGGLTLKPPKSWQPRTLSIPSVDFWKGVEPFLVGRSPNDFLFEGFVRDPKRRSETTAPKPWHPKSAGHMFARMMTRLGLVARDTGKSFTLHSLRHYVATALYNQSHDWVQVAKFLGHKNPTITMRLYANHVVEDSQRRLGEIAAAPCWGSGDALEDADVE